MNRTANSWLCVLVLACCSGPTAEAPADSVGLTNLTSIPERVAHAINEPNCPRLFALYGPDMKQALSERKNADFCNGIVAAKGKIIGVKPIGREGDWQLYSLQAGQGEWLLKLAFDPSNTISGLVITQPLPPEPPVASVPQPLMWPLKAPTFVFWGGASKEVNHHVTNQQQRRGVDLVMVDDAGKRHRGDGKCNEDYYIYGQEIVSAAAGTVHIVVDGVPNNEVGDMNPYLVPGNVVVVAHGNGQYAHYAHLKPGSIKVSQNQTVSVGDVLGLVGNSGNSSEPHLHFHIQDAATIGKGYGVEPAFAEVNVIREDGPVELEAAYKPLRGDIVTPKLESAEAALR